MSAVRPPADSMKGRLLAAATLHAGRPAIWSADGSLSYEELFVRARTLADRIDAAVVPGLPVGIYCQRELPAYVGVFAAVLSGRPYVPLNPGFPPERLRAIAGLANVGAIVCSGQTSVSAIGMLPGLPAGTVVFDGDCQIAGRQPGEPPVNSQVTQGNLLYIMFTSGTTGVPKGVCVSDRNVCAYIDGIHPISNLTPEDRCTQFFDLSFDLSAHDMFVTWCAGAQICVLPKDKSMEVASFVNDRAITSWFSVPSLAAFCDRLGQLKPGSLPSLKTALFCGEALTTPLARRFQAAAPSARVWNLYGPTEATIAFTAFELTGDPAIDELAVMPLGGAIGGQTLRLEPHDSNASELLLGGRQVTLGYVNNPEETARRFLTGSDGVAYYRTGDIASFDARFGMLFHGRADDQVKINGYRVELMEIEAALRDAAGTPEVAAIAWPKQAPDHIVAIVVGSQAASDKITAKCRSLLPSYMVPRRILHIDTMPVSSSGKIDRGKLKSMLSERGR